MKTTAAPQVEAAASTLWRCGGRTCGAGECEHEENELHRHASGTGPTYAPQIVHEVLRSSGSALPAAIRHDMEGQLQHNFANVRIHTDATAASSARAVEADAYTVGSHIVFGPGRFDPASPSGRRLLLHELTHAAQSSGQDPVAAQGRLRVSSPEEPHEVYAERVAHAGHAAEAPPSSARLTLNRSTAVTVEDHLERGSTLPYREATNYLSCMDIMDDATYCNQEVLGITPPPSPPQTCVPSRSLTWADFRGTPGGGTYGALTRFSFSSTSAQGRDWIVATFEGATSWVRAKYKNAANRAQNGCAPTVTQCQQWFASNSGTYSLTAGTGCAASPQPDTSLEATSSDECSSVLGAECDRVAVLESARLLHHEQLHFDLACAMAAKGNAALAASPAPSTTTILSAVRTKANSQTSAYDTQTQHGCDASAQSTWDTAVGQGLPAVTIP